MIARIIGTAVALFLLATGFASAQQVQVNKAFSPASVVLGGQTTVTVSLQNSSTTSAATITSFSDDIATMAGYGQIYTAFTPTTSCAGGTPAISGTRIVMTSGSIPIAPSSSTPGTCTITFEVYGDAIGNGFNTIPAASVVTSNGSPAADVTQTLTVQTTTITVTGTNASTVQTGDTTSVSYTIANPTNGNTGSSAPVAITNVGFAITSNATYAYTVNAATITPGCGGSFVLPAAGGTTGTTTFSGLTIPAGSSCVVTISTTTPTAQTVNYTLPLSPTAGYINDAQNVTNSAGVSTQAKFVSGQPNVTKSFTPTSAADGATSVLKISIQNVLSDYAFTSANESDTLPGTLLVSATAPTSTSCGTPTYGGAGTGTFTITGATIAAGATCNVSVTVNVPAGQAAGTLTNTIPLANFNGTLSGGITAVTGAAANATATLVVTAAGGGITSSKVASPTSAGVNVPVKITATFTSQGAGVFHGGVFTDNFPQTLVSMVALTDAAHLPTFTAGCSSQGDTPGYVFGGTGGNQSVSFSGLDMAANGSCAVTYYVEFPNQSGVSRIDTNIISGASFYNASSVSVSGRTPQATITELPTFTVTSYVASNSGLTSQAQLVASTVNVPTGFTDTNGTVVINLTAGKVTLTGTPQISFSNCPATATVTNIAGSAGAQEQFTVSLGTATLSQTCTISYYVVDESAAAGTFTPGVPTYSSPLTGGVAQSGTAQNNVTFTAPQPIGISKAYTPTNQIQAGGAATAVISLVIPKAGTLAVTQAQGVSFTDNLPTNLNFSPTPNVGTTGCTASGQPAPSFTITGSSITFSNLTVTTTGTTQTACALNFDVTSNVVGAPLNQIPAGAVTSTAGAGSSNTVVAKASLTVSAGLGIQKTFLNTTLQIGGTDYVRLLITNTATPSNISGGSLVDAMPASLVLASTTEGPIQAGDPVLCGGTIAGTVGSSSFTLNGLAVTGDIGGVAGQCVVYVQVAAATSAAPGSVTNTIASGGVNIGGYSNQNAGSGTVTLTAPPAPTLTKTFAPASIAPGGTSVLTITVANTATGSAPLGALALTDTLPANVTVAATPNAATTCGAGSVTATAGASAVTLATGTVAAGATCTIVVSVTSSSAGSYTNTIAAAALTDTQGATNAASATATLQVSAPVTLSKAFLPLTIAAGATSVLSITIANTATGAVALSGLALTDTLPAGVTIAAVPNATLGCAGTVTSPPGGTSVAISNASIGAAASCTLSVNVTGTVGTTYTNTIAANAVTDTQGASNAAPATATLTIVPAALTLAKAFAPASIAAGGSSTLTITIPNTASGAVALSALALTDTLPANLTIAALPSAATTCGAGTVTATAGGSSVALSGGSVAMNGSCTITVNVTGSLANAYTNTIAPSALTDTQNVSNGNTATANLTITAGAPTLSKAFAPATITAGAAATLTITLANTATGSIALSSVGLTDSLPTGLTIAAVPNASTTCGAGTLTATAGGTSVALAAGSVGAGASCTLSVSVTGAIANSYTNTLAVGALSDAQSISTTSAATAPLTIVPAALTIAKAFAPASIVSGATSTLTITIPNTAAGAVALSALALSDTLPPGLTIAATPSAATTCGAGTVTATAGGTSVALSGGSVAANASCTITVNVTGSVANAYTNTIPASALTDTQNVSNGTSATAPLTITPASTALSKSFAPAAITSGGTSTLTITIPNTAPGAVALSALALTDTLPANITIAATPSAATTCGAGTVSATAGGSSVALSGGSVAVNGTCTIVVNVTGSLANAYTNTIAASALTDAQNVTNGNAATANLTITGGAPTLAKVFAPAAITSGGTSTLTITLANTAAGAVALTGAGLTDSLPAGITIAALPNASTTCGAGTLTAIAGGTSVVLAAGSVAATASCTITVTVTGSVANAYTNTISASALTDAQNVTNASSASAPLTIAPAAISIAKAFSPASIASGGTSTLTITIPNTAAGSVALSALALTDTLPANITIAATPSAATTCGAGTVTAAAGASSVALAGGSVAPNGSCTITVNVTGSVANAYTNTIAPNALTDTQNVTNGNSATAGLTITPAATTLSKSFAPASITAGGSSTLTITIPNTAPGAVALSALALTDTLPANVTIAATPNAITTCGAGSVTATAGGSSVALAGGALAASAACTITVSVTGTVANAYTNTIAASALTDTQNVTNAAAATSVLTIVPAPIGLSKTFAPSAITAGGTSTLTITIANTAAGAVALSALALTDTLPANITIAATPNAITTCGAGSVTAPAGGPSVALTGGSVAANGACTVSVHVTGSVATTYTNTIPANALADTQNLSNAGAAVAGLTIAPAALTIAKAFSPATIAAGGTSTLTITIPNTAAGSVALSAMALADTLPAGVTIAATPSAATTCGAGTVTATAGGSSVALAGGSVAANGSCTITVNITGTIANGYTNTIAANALTDTQNVSNATSASALLTITPAPATLTKSFVPASITAGGASTLTITIPNTAAGAVALSGLALTDTLPPGLTIASPPSAATTCGAGSVAAVAGGPSVALSGGTLAANASCTFSVRVGGTVANTYTNTIAASALTNTQNVSNASPASAVLAIVPGAIALSKAFAPASISAGGTSILTITIPNTAAGAIALSTMTLTDALPAGVTVAAAPNATTTCGAGSVTAIAGASSIALAGGGVGANATCTISATVTGTLAGAYTNTIPASALGDTQAITNGAPATAVLTIVPNALAVTKAFAPASIHANGTALLTITIPNTAGGAVALTGMTLTDTLPANLTLAAVPNAATTCGAGSVSAAPGAAGVTLSGGSVAANATCTISVTVTSALAGSYTNTIPANALGDTQGVTDPNPATAQLTILPAGLTIAKAFAPAAIAAGGSATLTITVPNTAPGAVALSSMALTDALPAGLTVAATPNAATTCGSGTVTAAAGATSVVLASGSLAAAAVCTITVSVTGSATNAYTNTIPATALSDAQNVTNAAAATAILTITPNVIGLTKAFSPATISAGGTSVLTVTIPNTGPGAIALTGLAFTDALPAGLTIAAPPSAATSCGAGSVAAPAGGASVTFGGGSVAANATCTVTVNVTAVAPNTYTNTIPAGGLADAQGTSNTSPASATLAVVTATLAVTKSSSPSAATVGPGETIAYTIVVTNNGTAPETNATIADSSRNATLVPGSVRVNRRPVADTVITSGASFGTIPAGGSATITYSATVLATVASGATVTNSATASGDTACAGAVCTASSPPNSVQLPILSVVKTIDALTRDTVLLGQTVTYAMTITNSGTGPAAQVVLTDPVPLGVTPIAGSITLNGGAAPGATVVGQTVTIPIVLLAPGAAAIVTFQGTITAATTATLTNVVSVGAAGLQSLAMSNPVVAQLVPSTLNVTKTTSATTATAGDRVDYVITVAPVNGVGYTATTVTDTLPGGETFAPGTARVNGRPLAPVVSGHALTWLLPNLSAPVTLAYSTVIGVGVQQNQQLTNTVSVLATAPGGAPAGRGSASASVLITSSSFDACYPITGRVYLDVNGSGRFHDPDVGIGAVHIYLDNGESVVTDAFGRYDFPCVHPGMHALRLNERTLPAGIVPFDDRNIDSEKSTRRLVHHIFDTYLIEDINFAVTGKAVK